VKHQVGGGLGPGAQLTAYFDKVAPPTPFRPYFHYTDNPPPVDATTNFYYSASSRHPSTVIFYFHGPPYLPTPTYRPLLC